MWGATKKTLSYGGKIVNLGTRATMWAAKAPFKLVGIDKLLDKGLELGGKGVDKAEWAVRTGREAIFGVGNAVGKSALGLAAAPLVYLKRLLVDNARDVYGDIFTLKTPKNILKSPLYFGQGIKEGIHDARDKYKEIVKNAMEYKPFAALNSVRKALFATLAIPFKGVYKPVRQILDTPIAMGKNILNAHLAYPQSIIGKPNMSETTALSKGIPAHLKGGFGRVKGAPATAAHEMEAEVRRMDMLEAIKRNRQRVSDLWGRGKKWTGDKWTGFVGNGGAHPVAGGAQHAAAHP